MSGYRLETISPAEEDEARPGRDPVERDTLYNVVTGPEAPDEASALVQ